MATCTGSDTLAVADWEHDSESKSDRYLAARLAAAGADFKGVAVASFVLAVAVASLAWLAVGVLAEHWLVPGGLPAAVRWAWFVAGVTALGAAIVRWMVPLVRYRVNLVYAARAIEQDHPELHNDLVNAVLVKAQPEHASPPVVRSLERRAAKRLSTLPGDGVADRIVPLRLTLGLAALVVTLVVYQLVSPRSMVVSAARLLVPWCGLAPPVRVEIEPPTLACREPSDPDEPGADRPLRPLRQDGGVVILNRGLEVVVETRIEGLGRDERAVLVVTPLREGATPWQLPLVPDAGRGRMTAVVADTHQGLEHSVELEVVAGDARSDPVRIEVVDTPTLTIRKVLYEYPEYTGLGSGTSVRHGEGSLEGPEFTTVRIVAESDRPLEAAWIEPFCDGVACGRIAMDVKPQDMSRAIGKEFQLRMNDDRSAPKFTEYRLVFQPRSKQGTREPEESDDVRHPVKVIVDPAPEVRIDAPDDGVAVPPSAPVTIRVWASDARDGRDQYGLEKVGIEARIKGGRDLPKAWLLQRRHAGPFTGTLEIVPEKVGATVGSVLEYRAMALDGRPERDPEFSSWRTMRIAADARPQPPPQPPRPPQADGTAGANPGPTPSGAAPDASPGQPGAGEGPGDAGQRSEGAGAQAGAPQPGGAGTQDGDPRKAPGVNAAGRDGGTDEGKRDGESSAQDGAAAGEKAPAGGRSPEGGKSSKDGGEGGGDPASGERSEGEAPRGDPRAGDREQRGDQKDGAAGSSPTSERRDSPRNPLAADGTNDGEAMERILEHQRNAGRPQSESERSGENPNDPRAAERNAGQPPPCAGPDGKPCGKSGCNSCSGGKLGGSSGGGSGEGAEGQPGQEPSGAKPEGSGGSGTSGAGESGSGKSGAGKSGAGKSGAGESGAGESGAGESGAGESGSGQRGSREGGTGKTGSGQSGSRESEAGKGAEGGAQEGQGGKGQGRQGEGQDDQASAGTRPGEQGGDEQGGRRAGASGQTPAGTTDSPPDGTGATVGAGGMVGGNRGGPPPLRDGTAAPPRPVEWTEQDTAHVRNAADLAIEHLRTSVNTGRTDVLDELGWTPEQARAFLDRWDAMRRLADGGDVKKRGEFERALRSLGLRPAGASVSRDVSADAKGGQAEGRRSRPPAAYREQFEAFLRGAGGE